MSSLKIKKLRAWWLAYKLDYWSLFLLMFVHFGRLQLNQYFSDGDGFYHAKMAMFLRQGLLLKTMPWMQFSTLKDNFTDHQLIYHLLLAPFTYINTNPLIGIKVATVLFAALMIVVLYWLLKKTNVVWPWFFAALLSTFAALTFRLSLIKVNSLSLIVIWFLLYAIFFRKIWLTAILGSIYVWLYAGWPLAIFIVLLYALTDWFYHRYHTSRIHFAWNKIIHFFRGDQKQFKMIRLSLALLLGIVLGIIFSPYWPSNLYFYYQQFFQIGVLNLGNQLPVGNEWYGVSLLRAISYGPLLFIGAFTTFIFLSFNLKKVSLKTWFTFILTFIFLVLTIKSRRYVEYYLPFGLLFCAYGISDLVRLIDWSKLRRFYAHLHWSLKGYLSAALLVMLTLVMPGLYRDVLRPTISERWTMTKFTKAIGWLQKNVPEKSIVFNNMWDDWGLFFYHNDRDYYIIGLDPTFMYNYDPALTQKYFDITLYQDEAKYYSPDQIASIIKNEFHSNYVVIEKSESYKKFIENMRNSSMVKQSYEDSEALIFTIK
ncbi:MAG: hypothetical protein C3F02_01925 [Parcubacteria group bacterium]|nr:MAG: hypothetical protein C3F02_01925 [Parcubacteria group bacterium]